MEVEQKILGLLC